MTTMQAERIRKAAFNSGPLRVAEEVTFSV